MKERTRIEPASLPAPGATPGEPMQPPRPRRHERSFGYTQVQRTSASPHPSHRIVQ
jgi:hypothetical protein